MKKKKILFHSNHSQAYTGFGKNAKNILKYLTQTGKYEVIELANGLKFSHPQLKKLPWKALGTLPDSDQEIKAINQNSDNGRAAGYGAAMIDRIIEEERPDIYIGAEDIWAFNGYYDKYWWNKISCMIWTTLDSLPILPTAIEAAPKIKNYYVWASFAEKALAAEDFPHVKTLRGSIDCQNFFRLEDEQRRALRQRHQIPESDFVIGFVFRNQLRKSVPNLLDGFKLFLQRHPESNARLLLHTHWSEGWDIPRFLAEKNIDPNLVLTTYVCKNCRQYQVKPFEGQKHNCPFCGAEKSQETTQVSLGVTEPQLNEVYNLMDVYCHPFTSGGQEIPVQEAKLTELITLVTNYSCGEDNCSPESGGLPLEWSEYREPGTQFIKASTYPASICKQLTKIHKMNAAKKKEWGKRARNFVIKNFSIDAIGGRVERIIDQMPFVTDFNFKRPLSNPSYEPPPIESDAEWLIDLYKNVFNRELDETDEGHQHWIQRLKTDLNRQQVLAFFLQKAQEENQQHTPPNFEDLLDPDDKGKRLLYVMPQSIGDLYLSTALFEDIKNNYPDYNLYVATDPKYFEVVDGNPYVKKVLPYTPLMDNLPWLEGNKAHEGFFEVAFLPFLGTQRMYDYQHNGKDKISLQLCTS